MKKKPRPESEFVSRRLLKKDWKILIPIMSASQRQGVSIGADTWRSFDTKRMTWFDWMKISEALAVGESICEKAAGKSEGGKYNRLYGKWLEENGLDNIAKAIRSWLREIRRHHSEIDTWRNNLPVEQRMKMQHPRTVLRKWKAQQAESRP